MSRGVRLALLGLLCALLPACSGREQGQRGQDEALLLSLSEARAWQRRADLHLQGGDTASAIADVREVLSVKFPKGAPEAEDARLDARARLAQLYLRSAPGSAEGEDRALAELTAARGEAARDSFFRANLESVLGEVYEARGRRLQDPAAKLEARKQALAALERAIQIGKRLQRALFLGREEGR